MNGGRNRSSSGGCPVACSPGTTPPLPRRRGGSSGSRKRPQVKRLLRPAQAVLAGASVLAAAACAARRAAVPEITNLEPYNGEWVLQVTEREAPSVEFASRDGYGFARATAHRVLTVVSVRAERFVLEVSDSLFRVSSDEPGFSFSLPMDGTPVEVLAEDGALLQTITLTWSRGSPVVRRTLPGAGWVSDRLLPGVDGTLTVMRTAAMRNVRGREVEGTRAVELTYVVLTAGRRAPGAGPEGVINEERQRHLRGLLRLRTQFGPPVRGVGQGAENHSTTWAAPRLHLGTEVARMDGPEDKWLIFWRHRSQ